MRTTGKGTVLGAAVASLLLVPLLATAESVEDQLDQMQNRMAQLEDQLRWTNDQLTDAKARVDDQASAIERAGIADENSALSGLSSFLSDTDFYGWVNASYTVQTHSDHNANIRGQNSGSTQAPVGAGVPVNPLASVPIPNVPHNMTFEVEQVWFGMDNAATADSRGGFHVDILFGDDAGGEHLRGYGCGGLSNSGGGATDTLCLFTAYASYLAPIGPKGIEIQAGKLPTMLGPEVVPTPWNFNISRGLVWDLQPVTNLGVVISADLGHGFGLALGVIDNPLGLEDPDNNLAKSFTGQVSWSNDKFGAKVSGNWGEQNSDGGNEGSILDLILSADPTDFLSLWFNFDWVYESQPSGVRAQAGGQTNDNTFGFALAGRYAITDQTGIAVRGEYVFNEDAGNFVRALNNGVAGGPRAGSIQQWSATLTADHHLTDNLMIRGEFRYDGAKVKGGSNQVFCGSGTGCAYPAAHSDQFVFIVDMTYEF